MLNKYNNFELPRPLGVTCFSFDLYHPKSDVRTFRYILIIFSPSSRYDKHDA